MEDEEYNEILGLALVCKVIAIDTEGTSITDTDYRDGTGYGFGISISGRRRSGDLFSCYYPTRHTSGNVSDRVRENLYDVVRGHPCVVFHNAKHDIVALETMGIKRSQFYCTMLMQNYINENVISKKLNDLGMRYFNEGKATGPMFQAMLALHGYHPNFPANIMAEYAAKDAELTLRLFEKLYPHFKKQGFDG